MPTEIKLPSLGEGIESGNVLEIFVKVGDVIKKDQSLVEMETDKATVSVPSPHAGKILSIAVKEGEMVKVGMLLVALNSNRSIDDPWEVSQDIFPSIDSAIKPPVPLQEEGVVVAVFDTGVD